MTDSYDGNHYFGGFALDDYESPRHNPHIKRDVLPHIKRIGDGAQDVISRLVRAHFPETQFALVLWYMLEQCEDIYEVLMDDLQVGTFEVPRMQGVAADDAEIDGAEVSVVPLREYRARLYRTHGKRFPEKFLPALELMRELLREARGPEPDAKEESDWDDWTYEVAG